MRKFQDFNCVYILTGSGNKIRVQPNGYTVITERICRIDAYLSTYLYLKDFEYILLHFFNSRVCRRNSVFSFKNIGFIFNVFYITPSSLNSNFITLLVLLCQSHLTQFYRFQLLYSKRFASMKRQIDAIKINIAVLSSKLNLLENLANIFIIILLSQNLETKKGTKMILHQLIFFRSAYLVAI